MEDLIRAFEIDLTPRQKGRAGDSPSRRVDLRTFPRSRRLAARGQRAGAPFGWIALRLPDAPPVEPLVDMAALMAGQRMQPEQHVSPSGVRRRSERPSGAGPRDRRSQTRFEAPPRRAEPPPVIPKSLPRPEPQPPKTRYKVGDQVAAEVLSNDNRTVRVRLLEANGEELKFDRAYYPRKQGERTKVKIVKMDAAGKVTRVAP